MSATIQRYIYNISKHFKINLRCSEGQKLNYTQMSTLIKFFLWLNISLHFICFVFLKRPSWDSSFCLTTDACWWWVKWATTSYFSVRGFELQELLEIVLWCIWCFQKKQLYNCKKKPLCYAAPAEIDFFRLPWMDSMNISFTIKKPSFLL